MAPRLPALLPVLFSVAAAAGGGEARFMTTPDIRGDRVVFAWEGDLYTTGLEGGTAIRLTSHPGGELAPKLSPDGKWIAYTTSNNNVLDVRVMPSEGGAPVKPVRSDRDARYARWVTDNVDKVLKLSNGDVGYMHVTAMGGPGIMQFDKFWRAFRYKKGLVIDVRGNGGGWTEYFMIDKLERQQVAFNVLKGMEPYRYPNPASRAHFVLVSNEDNGSDGEAFVEHFKARKLGTVVGVPSWGGLVGIVNGQRTIDNGRVEQSNNAFYGREGKWLVENHGGDPDILQDNDPASVVAGKDLQLEKAVGVALQKIKDQPWQLPPVPAYSRR